MQGFDIEKYYENAKRGDKCGDTSVVNYLNSFPKVVLWGASFQGKAIGKKLLELGVSIDCYWDIRFEELRTVNGLPVVPPFSTADKEGTLVILCIGNRVIHRQLLRDMRMHDYFNIVHGDYLYMGLLCPFTIETGINARRCSGTMECRQVYCHRIAGIMKGRSGRKDPFFLPSVTLIVNQRCSLKCKYCTSYMNEYPAEERINFPLERICKDVDRFFGAVDGVGTITVMGGEPFLHPEISKIIEHLCQWKNFGLISIATSATCVIKKEQLVGLHDERVNVSFSNYTPSISEGQKKLFYQNIELMKEAGVQHTVGLFSPEWIIPFTLRNKHNSDERAQSYKSDCDHWHQIKNGKVHPCDLAQSIYSLHIADYPTDYIDLDQHEGEELREKLIEYHNRPFYESCRHHGYPEGRSNMVARAAEQGYVDLK